MNPAYIWKKELPVELQPKLEGSSSFLSRVMSLSLMEEQNSLTASVRDEDGEVLPPR
jgi:hypothetical protein